MFVQPIKLVQLPKMKYKPEGHSQTPLTGTKGEAQAMQVVFVEQLRHREVKVAEHSSQLSTPLSTYPFKQSHVLVFNERQTGEAELHERQLFAFMPLQVGQYKLHGTQTPKALAVVPSGIPEVQVQFPQQKNNPGKVAQFVQIKKNCSNFISFMLGVAVKPEDMSVKLLVFIVSVLVGTGEKRTSKQENPKNITFAIWNIGGYGRKLKRPLLDMVLVCLQLMYPAVLWTASQTRTMTQTYWSQFSSQAVTVRLIREDPLAMEELTPIWCLAPLGL